MVKVSPSILSADFSNLKEEISKIERGGADFVHIDVMDGRFVPNITVGIPVVKALSRISSIPLDVHLMIVEPERYVEEFYRNGAKIITVHQEACIHLNRTLNLIKESGGLAGVAINPSTPVNSIEEVLHIADLVLVMLVNPGFSGQKMIKEALRKVRKLKDIKKRGNLDFMIEVDGGVKLDNFREVVESGAEVLVSGSGIFGEENPEEIIKTMKSL